MLITIINSTDGRKVGCTIGKLTENNRQILRKTFSTIELQFTEYDLDGSDIQIVTAGEIQDKLYSSSKYQLITTLNTILKMEGGKTEPKPPEGYKIASWKDPVCANALCWCFNRWVPDTLKDRKRWGARGIYAIPIEPANDVLLGPGDPV